MQTSGIHPALGIDHGEARIGLAITDPIGILAHPLETIHQDKTPAIPRIIELIKLREIKTIILGLPLCMDGSEGTAAQKIRTFAKELQEQLPANIPLKFIDERLTTTSASEKLRSAGKNAKQQKNIIDQVAATEILNDWLSTTIDTPPPFEP